MCATDISKLGSFYIDRHSIQRGNWRQEMEHYLVLHDHSFRTFLFQRPHVRFRYYIRKKELRDLYSSPSIIRIIKWRRMIWTDHVARMEGKRNTCTLLVGKPEGRRPLGRTRRSGWIILGWISERWDGVMWTGLVWLRIGTGGELL
jgi:hypothetical protein